MLYEVITILIPNDRLSGLAGKQMGILDAFKPADDVLRQAVQGISDLITTHGMIVITSYSIHYTKLYETRHAVLGCC